MYLKQSKYSSSPKCLRRLSAVSNLLYQNQSCPVATVGHTGTQRAPGHGQLLSEQRRKETVRSANTGQHSKSEYYVLELMY